jgi:hypothetical protein
MADLPYDKFAIFFTEYGSVLKIIPKGFGICDIYLRYNGQ